MLLSCPQSRKPVEKYFTASSIFKIALAAFWSRLNSAQVENVIALTRGIISPSLEAKAASSLVENNKIKSCATWCNVQTRPLTLMSTSKSHKRYRQDYRASQRNAYNLALTAANDYFYFNHLTTRPPFRSLHLILYTRFQRL